MDLCYRNGNGWDGLIPTTLKQGSGFLIEIPENRKNVGFPTLIESSHLLNTFYIKKTKMACVDADCNMKFCDAREGMATVTVRFGLYIN